ncbi:UDP-N-acetylmuramate--L-alanine ligase [bacterium]|nr:UDP-N-acetylmuramate--L-alanine ligase [bacterium]
MKIHFIGIGGAGMSALATICLAKGEEVSGSDINENEAIARLRSMGARIYNTHSPSNICNSELVVYSSAIHPDNIELSAAREKGIPTIKRGELLAQLMEDKKAIVVAGTHGKTTTTSLISLMLERNNLDPTIIIGGEVNDIGGNAKLGKGGFFVAEADESDGSFLFLSPWIAVITNIDSDHLDYYGSLENIRKAFTEFLLKVKEDGFIVACIDDPYLRQIDYPRPVITYGFSEEAEIRGEDIYVKASGTSFKVIKGKEKFLELELKLVGKANVCNALAAVAVGTILNIPPEGIKNALENFGGVHRRLERIGCLGDILIFDDYAHHPTEISTTLKTLREAYPDRRIVCAFQPHRYTRTKLLYKELAEALKEADILVLTEIYPAGEKPIENVSARLIYESLLESGKETLYAENLSKVLEALRKLIQPGDIVLTLGAGDINKVAYALKEEVGLCSP